MGQDLLFCMWMTNSAGTICGKYSPFSTNLPLHLVGNQLIVCVWVYFWVLYYVPLIYVSVLLPLENCPAYCNFRLHLESRHFKSSNFVLFQIVSAIFFFFAFQNKFRICLVISPKVLLIFS